ncbi:hypothetical protein Tco_0510542, partial [Tanacetum coccineum]
NHHSSPNPTQQDPPTDTSAILQAIMALIPKVDTINSKGERKEEGEKEKREEDNLRCGKNGQVADIRSVHIKFDGYCDTFWSSYLIMAQMRNSDVESLKYAMGTLQTTTTIQHNILAQELTTLKSQIQNHDTISSDVESVKYALGTLQTNTTIQHNILAQELTTLKSQIQNHVSPKTPCSLPSHSSTQGLTSQMSALESDMKAINHTLHTLQDNTTTSVANLTKNIDEIKRQHFSQTSLANSSKAFESLEAKVEASQPAFSEVQSGVVIKRRRQKKRERRRKKRRRRKDREKLEKKKEEEAEEEEKEKKKIEKKKKKRRRRMKIRRRERRKKA